MTKNKDKESIITTRQAELVAASKDYEGKLLVARNVLVAAGEDQAAIDAIDGALLHEGIVPPGREGDEHLLFPEETRPR